MEASSRFMKFFRRGKRNRVSVYAPSTETAGTSQVPADHHAREGIFTSSRETAGASQVPDDHQARKGIFTSSRMTAGSSQAAADDQARKGIFPSSRMTAGTSQAPADHQARKGIFTSSRVTAGTSQTPADHQARKGIFGRLRDAWKRVKKIGRNRVHPQPPETDDSLPNDPEIESPPDSLTGSIILSFDKTPSLISVVESQALTCILSDDEGSDNILISCYDR
ncbi:uncharacterized protein LOC133191909 [Saccostrea echinata]|uniref:uncharacterized protein LOC133191909 n=1 Tax=Saccostrea echinata TaxID=191078 RepID=UPI002A8418D5|nr:uncharacterized protein LOC133191909 [Saccostrea echinata]